MKSRNFNSIVLYDMTIETIIVPNLHNVNNILSLEHSNNEITEVDVLSYGSRNSKVWLQMSKEKGKSRETDNLANTSTSESCKHEF